MVIDNWSLPCQYHLGNLENTLYLQPFEQLVDYTIDDEGRPYCTSVSGDVVSVACKSLQLNESSTYDNRFAFTYTLTAVITENVGNTHFEALKTLADNDYRLIVKTKEGMYYIINVEYPYTLSYSYEWSNSTDDCTLTFICSQNIPTMKLLNFDNTVTELVPKFCGYCSPRVESFDIIEKDCVMVGYEGDDTTYTAITTVGNSVWKTVKPLDFNYRNEYSGGSYADTIQFQIELSDYLTTFHYNILEFVRNRYVVRFNTSHGNSIVIGDEFGLFPSFELETSENDGNLNIITITLRQKGSFSSKYSASNIEDTVNTAKKRSGTADNRRKHTTYTLEISGMTFPTIECVSPTMAKRLILPQVGIDGEETGYFYVLEGYEDYYGAISDLILGTYSEETINDFDVSLYIYTNQCLNDFGCLYTTTLNAKNYLVNTTSGWFGIISSCGWEITQYDECLSFSQLSGESGVQEEVTYTSSCESGTEASFTIKVGDDEYEYIVKVIDSSSCFIENNTVSIVASAATLTFDMEQPANTISILDITLEDNATDLLDLSLNGYTLTVNVPAYTDDYTISRMFRITLESSNGGYCTVQITQDHPYMKWQIDYSQYRCIDGDKHYVYRKYTGYTANDITTPTDEYMVDEDRAPWESDSPDCAADVIINWVEADDVYYCEEDSGHDYEMWSASTEYECDGTTKYVKEYKMVSDDNENWSATTDTRLGDVIEYNSTDCGYCSRITRWTDNTGETICSGYALYYIAYEEYSDDCGETWTTTDSSKIGSMISENTMDCGGTGCSTSAETMIMWSEVEDETMCSGTSLYYKCYKYTSCTSGRTWERTDEYSAGTLIAEDSVQCGGGETTIYKWEDTDETTCKDGDLYYKCYRYSSTDGGTTWTQTSTWKIGTLIEEGSSECVECALEYRWISDNDSGDTICDEETHIEYYAAYHYWSDDCWVTRNLIESDGTQYGDVYQENSYACGYRTYKWEYIDDVCYTELPTDVEILDTDPDA